MGALNDAQVYIRARGYSGSGDLIDQTGNGHDASFPGGANDPLFLPQRDDGKKYFWNPNSESAGNLNLAVTGGISVTTLDSWGTAVRVMRDPDNGWRPSLARYTHMGSTHNNLALNSSGQLTGVVMLDDGLGGLDSCSWTTSSAVPDDGTESRWFRYHFDATTGILNAWYSDDAVEDVRDVSTWVQVLTDHDCSNTNGGFSNRPDFLIGWTGASGDPVRVLAAALQQDDSWTHLVVVDDAVEPYTGLAVITDRISSDDVEHELIASGRKTAIVDRDLLLLGADDYLDIVDHADLDFADDEDLTLAFWGRVYDLDGNQVLVGKKDDLTSLAGYQIFAQSDETLIAKIADGTENAFDTSSAVTQGQAFVAVLRLDDAVAEELEVYLDGTGTGSPVDTSAENSLENDRPLRIGAHGGATPASFLDGEVFAMALWRRALTEDEISGLSNEFAGQPVGGGGLTDITGITGLVVVT